MHCIPAVVASLPGLAIATIFCFYQYYIADAISLRRFENISLVVFNFKLFQKCRIFLPERHFAVMLFLRMNVVHNVWYLRFGIRKYAVPRLPLKPAATKAININPLRGIGFHILHKIADRLSGAKANKHVQVIIHAINRDHFVLSGFHNAGNVFVQRRFPNGANQRLPVFWRKNEMQVDLRISVSHDIVVCKSV